MATDDQVTPRPATEEDWGSVCDWAKVGDRFAPCLLELRRRVEALEAAGGRVPAAPAGGGLTVEQLAECLPGNAWQGPNGYSRRVFAEHLLSHPITGPRLRTEPPNKVPRLFAAPLQRTFSKDGNTCIVDALADDGTCWICQLGVDYSRNHFGETVRTDWQQITPLPDREEPLND